jgi:hypothetical protein
MDDNPKKYPQLPPCTLERSPHPLQLQRKWSLPFHEAVGLCVGEKNALDKACNLRIEWWELGEVPNEFLPTYFQFFSAS